MTGRAGGRRAVQFPLLQPSKGAPRPLEEASANPIVLLRQMWNAKDVIGEKLQTLGSDSDGMHGDLQVVLSAARQIAKSAEFLILSMEGEPKR